MAKHQAALFRHGHFWIHLTLKPEVAHLRTGETSPDGSKTINNSKHIGPWGFWIL